jgi:Protein of unknown function (DUF3916)
MRRLDLHPHRKLRNPGRHLRAFARWPERIVQQLPTPDQCAGQRFRNFKVPVHAKLVDPLHATPEMQRACLSVILAAAQAIERSPLRPANCRVACLVSTPSLFQSEVTLFFDDTYFQTFLPREEGKRTYFEGGWVEDEPADVEALGELAVAAPDGMTFHGGMLLRQYDPDWGPKPVEQITWVWSYPPR